jgi:hypothetical protein
MLRAADLVHPSLGFLATSDLYKVRALPTAVYLYCC